MSCRCGYDGPDEGHPCHGHGYTCKKPGRMRFYNTRPVALAGAQMKLQVEATFACDACWGHMAVLLAAWDAWAAGT